MKIKGLTRFALVLSLCFSSQLLQANSEWQEVINQSGVTLSQRILPGKTYKQIKGVMTIKGRIAPLVEILHKPELCPQWLNDCRSSEIVKQINPAERINYTVVDAPFLLEDRDMYIHSKAQFDSHTNTVTISLRGVENYAETKPNRVRVKSLNGFWKFQQLNKNQVKVSYQMYSDPQVLPAPAVNSSTPKSLLKTFNKLRQLAHSPAMRNIRFQPAKLKAITVR